MTQGNNGSPTRAVRASRKWQKKQRRKGLCPKCGEPADGYYCAKHKALDAARKKARRHLLQKRNGAPGKKKSRASVEKVLSNFGSKV